MWWRRTNCTSLSESSSLDVSKPPVTSTITRRLPETMDSVSPQLRRLAHTCVERTPQRYLVPNHAQHLVVVLEARLREEVAVGGGARRHISLGVVKLPHNRERLLVVDERASEQLSSHAMKTATRKNSRNARCRWIDALAVTRRQQTYRQPFPSLSWTRFSSAKTACANDASSWLWFRIYDPSWRPPSMVY